ncbi:DUF6678 family protein [Alteromonas sp. C1M14]|uniref:DUF6678 family protein n=1 Tax=Alteromonas sp. C1M14 TaxID=2841567 RepID=UPI001C0A3606|nr:DUF6678 family protein [Alteromonas sp. C1M14]MBU2978735.1 hypothetical protein [Alteromonas sp. C1M14]
MHIKTLDYINKHQLTSVMNNTKWNNVEIALNEREDFVPHVRYKLIYEDKPNGFTSVWWDELLVIAQNIEWLEVQPFTLERRGALVDDKKTDYTDFVSSQLKKYAIPYSIEDGMYRIWGYLRVGNPVKFV